MSGVSTAIAGAVIGVVDFFFYRSASDVIARGDFFFGFGWFFENMSREQAVLFQYLGIAGMAIGGVIVLAGLIMVFRNK